MRYRIPSHIISSHTKFHAGLPLLLLVACLMFGALVWLDQRPGQTQSEPTPITQLTTYHQQGVGSNPDGFVAWNGAVYFALGDQSSYSEKVGGLWRTDGTAAGTTLVKAILGVQQPSIKRVGDLLFFKVRVERPNSSWTYQLWRSDGTPDGTLLLADDTPYDGEYVILGELVYFTGADTEHGRELWQTDGTRAGTAMVTDATAGASGTYPRRLTVLADRLIFVGGGISEGSRLWMSDGTAAGTQLVADAPPNITNLVRLQDMLLFAVYVVDTGAHELWRYDGADSRADSRADSVPNRVAAFVPTADTSASLGGFTLFAERLFFAANNGAGQLLWQSDGTAAGTEVVVELEPESNTESISPAAVTNSFYYFKVYDHVKNSDVELWRTDGSMTGTLLVGTYDYEGRAFENVDESPRRFVARDDTLYFISYDHALWQSDGTVDGTVAIDTRPVNAVAPAEDGLYLSLFEQAVGYELGYSDGTGEGTQLIKDIDLSHVGIDVQRLATVNGRVYTVLSGESNALPQLWMSENATTPATLFDDAYTFYELHAVGDKLFVRGADGVDETLLVANPQTNQLETLQTFERFEVRLALGNQILFTVFDEATDDHTLWRSDGTTAGTYELADGLLLLLTPLGPAYVIFPLGDSAVILDRQTLWLTDGTASGTSTFDLATATGGSARLVAQANTVFYLESEGWLWRSDGTAAGTVRLGDQPVGETRWVEPLGDAIFFEYGGQLWHHDGTTTEVNQLTTGPELDANTHFPYQTRRQRLGDTFFFVRTAGDSDDKTDRELWKSDGSLSGTQLVQALGPIEKEPGDPYPGPSLYSLPSLLFYLLYDADQGWGLWRSDGTSAGTELLNDDFPVSYYRSQFATTDTHIFFHVPTTLYGWELWKSDGTVDGTGLLKDIAPGPERGYIGSRVIADRVIYFVADDGVHGSELWRSDGTTEGTQMVVDLNPGLAGSSIARLDWNDGVLYFSANNGRDGQQLFSLVTVTPRSLPPAEEPNARDAQADQIYLPHVSR